MKNHFIIYFLFVLITCLNVSCNKYSNQLPEIEIESDKSKAIVSYKSQAMFALKFNRFKSAAQDSVSIDIENISGTQIDSASVVLYYFNEKAKKYSNHIYTDIISFGRMESGQLRKTVRTFVDRNLQFDEAFLECAVLYIKQTSVTSNDYAGVYNDGFVRQNVNAIDSSLKPFYSFAKGYVAADGKMRFWFNAEKEAFSISGQFIDTNALQNIFIKDANDQLIVPCVLDTLHGTTLFERVNGELRMRLIMENNSSLIQTLNTYVK